MTSALIVVALAAGVAAVTMQPKHHTPPPPPQSAAERGVNSHYVFHKQWYKSSDNLPKGNRAGAASYPITSPLHWEIPERNSAAYWGDPTAGGYESLHQRGESGFLRSNRYSYTGNGLLPAGTWTGEPLKPYEEYHTATWRRDVNGTYRKDEVSGKVMTNNSMQAMPGKTPAPPNP